jgi:hypothetical protein
MEASLHVHTAAGAENSRFLHFAPGFGLSMNPASIYVMGANILHNSDVALADRTSFLNLLSQRRKLMIYEG